MELTCFLTQHRLEETCKKVFATLGSQVCVVISSWLQLLVTVLGVNTARVWVACFSAHARQLQIRRKADIFQW